MIRNNNLNFSLSLFGKKKFVKKILVKKFFVQNELSIKNVLVKKIWLKKFLVQNFCVKKSLVKKNVVPRTNVALTYFSGKLVVRAFYSKLSLCAKFKTFPSWTFRWGFFFLFLLPSKIKVNS